MEVQFPQYIHCIGIKGSGVAALATFLKQYGCDISGSDTSDIFYTDAVLKNAGISWCEGFSKQNIPKNTELIIYSAAYSTENNAELSYAKACGISCIAYPEALGMISLAIPSWAIIGTHGKTSTVGLISILCKSQGIPVSTLVGSAMVDLNDSAVLYQGNNAFFAEVCEYKNHFEYFSPHAAVFTSAEWEHPDYFTSADDVYNAFYSFLQRMPSNAPLIACYDDAGVRTVVSMIEKHHHTHKLFLYTRSEQQPSTNNIPIIRIYELPITTYKGMKAIPFRIQGLDSVVDEMTWYSTLPASLFVDNTVAAIISVATYMKRAEIPIDWKNMHNALTHYKGVRRRSEVVFQDERYIIMDDYAHHPTAISKTLSDISAFYAPKRLIVQFMPHTHARTIALWNNFVRSFDSAQNIIINDIYASAREHKTSKNTYSGKSLAQEIARQYPLTQVQYIPSVEESAEYVATILQHGDVFLSMGAGDSFRTSHIIAQKILQGDIT